MAQDKALFVLDWVPYAALMGFWNVLGGDFSNGPEIDAKIIRGYGSADTIKRIAAKNSDFGFADTGTLVVTRSKGAKEKSLGGLSQERMKATVDIISKYMKVENKPAVSDIYAPQFLKKVLP